MHATCEVAATEYVRQGVDAVRPIVFVAQDCKLFDPKVGFKKVLAQSTLELRLGIAP